MQITPLNGYSNFNKTFRSLGYTPTYYTDVYGTDRATQNTTGIRQDLDYEKLARIIQTRFKDCKNVNIMPMNVSDGTEAYCVANAIIRNEGLEKFKQKYSPVKATDVSLSVIENYGKKGLLHLYNDELFMFDNLGINALEATEREYYKEYILFQSSYPDGFYKLNPDYSKLFQFETMDLQKRLASMKDEGNSVIFIRNCLKQSFGEIGAPIIIAKAANALKGSSLLITGGYDTNMQIIKEALQNYFNEISSNIWELKQKPNTLNVSWKRNGKPLYKSMMFKGM